MLNDFTVKVKALFYNFICHIQYFTEFENLTEFDIWFSKKINYNLNNKICDEYINT